MPWIWGEMLQRCAASGGSVRFSIVCDAMPSLLCRQLTHDPYDRLILFPDFPVFLLALVVTLCSVRVTRRLSACVRHIPEGLAWASL